MIYKLVASVLVCLSLMSGTAADVVADVSLGLCGFVNLAVALKCLLI